MKWEAVIEVEQGGFKEARSLGGPFTSYVEAMAYAIGYMDLAVIKMHRDRIDGKSYSLPFGINGTRTAYLHDNRCNYGIRVPKNCKLFA